MNKNITKKQWIIIGCCVAASVLFVMGWMYMRNTVQNDNGTEENMPHDTTTSTQIDDIIQDTQSSSTNLPMGNADVLVQDVDTSQWHSYKSTDCGFAVKHPSSWYMTKTSTYAGEDASRYAEFCYTTLGSSQNQHERSLCPGLSVSRHILPQGITQFTDLLSASDNIKGSRPSN